MRRKIANLDTTKVKFLKEQVSKVEIIIPLSDLEVIIRNKVRELLIANKADSATITAIESGKGAVTYIHKQNDHYEQQLEHVEFEMQLVKNNQETPKPIGVIGGKARALNLSPKRRSEIAKNAADTRWKSSKDKRK